MDNRTASGQRYVECIPPTAHPTILFYHTKETNMWTINGEPLGEVGNFFATLCLFYAIYSVIHTTCCGIWKISDTFKGD